MDVILITVSILEDVVGGIVCVGHDPSLVPEPLIQKVDSV